MGSKNSKDVLQGEFRPLHDPQVEHYYEGDFDETLTGTGTVYIMIGEKKVKVFEGEVKEKQPVKGKLWLEMNPEELTLMYDGEFQNGEYHGQGKHFYLSDEVRYDGRWVNGQVDGFAIEYYKSGIEKYRGQFHDGVYHGEGVLKDEFDRIAYQGEFVNGIQKGQLSLDQASSSSSSFSFNYSSS